MKSQHQYSKIKPKYFQDNNNNNDHNNKTVNERREKNRNK